MDNGGVFISGLFGACHPPHFVEGFAKIWVLMSNRSRYNRESNQKNSNYVRTEVEDNEKQKVV